jgi:RNA polymerase sigma factor (sigma-70 family)
MNNERTRCNDEVLQSTIEVLNSIIEALQDTVNNGKSLGESCRERNLLYKKVRSLVMGISSYNILINENLKEIELPEEDGYEKLYREIFNLSKSDNFSFPVDLKETIDIVIDNALTEREKKILSMRYALGEFEYDSTFEEIGKVFNVNKERIRQIVLKAIRKLRNPKRSKVIRDGIASYKEATRENEIIAEAAKEKRIAKMQEFKEQVKNGLITNGN